MFYIIEKKEQLSRLLFLDNCFIDFISFNDNFHFYINELSLIYLRPLNSHKGYILCIKHNESLSLDIKDVFEFLNKNTSKLFVLNKKEALYFYPYSDKLFDINFIEFVDLSKHKHNNCISFYYNKYNNLPNINYLIPISKHYEEKEYIFDIIKPIIQKYNNLDEIYKFNNTLLTEVFFNIEKNGIKINKNCFIERYDKIKYPEFNIKKGKIYSHYNLYTLTGRPSNSYNLINFAALDKDSGERECYIPENDLFVEFDFQGYHPRLVCSLINYPVPNDVNIYSYLNVDKKEMFENLYGGIKQKHINDVFFKKVAIYIDDMWDTYQFSKSYNTRLRKFSSYDKISQNKLFNYILQAEETYNNVIQLDKIIKLLNGKKTKLVLYTYDAFLFDFSKEDGNNLLKDILETLNYPVNVKIGKNYNVLVKE